MSGNSSRALETLRRVIDSVLFVQFVRIYAQYRTGLAPFARLGKETPRLENAPAILLACQAVTSNRGSFLRWAGQLFKGMVLILRNGNRWGALPCSPRTFASNANESSLS